LIDDDNVDGGHGGCFVGFDCTIPALTWAHN
jgi:hypothetical protein